MFITCHAIYCISNLPSFTFVICSRNIFNWCQDAITISQICIILVSVSARTCQYFERRDIMAFKSTRNWAELCHESRKEGHGKVMYLREVLIQTWYLKLGAGSWRSQGACCCVWRCWRPDADASDENSWEVQWTCRNLPGQSLQRIKNGEKVSEVKREIKYSKVITDLSLPILVVKHTI